LTPPSHVMYPQAHQNRRIAEHERNSSGGIRKLSWIELLTAKVVIQGPRGRVWHVLYSGNAEVHWKRERWHVTKYFPGRAMMASLALFTCLNRPSHMPGAPRSYPYKSPTRRQRFVQKRHMCRNNNCKNTRSNKASFHSNQEPNMPL